MFLFLMLRILPDKYTDNFHQISVFNPIQENREQKFSLHDLI